MKRLARGWSVLTVTALVTACASQEEAKRVETDETRAGNRQAQSLEVPPGDISRDAGAKIEEAIVVPKVQDERRAAGAAPTDKSPRFQAEAAPTVALRAVSAPANAIACCYPPPYQQVTDTERYQHLDESPVRLVAEHPVSTFSIDVDTGAYANVRRFLNAGQLPPQDAVRVEEMINYFDYQYAPPATRATPFRVATELAHAPWNSEAMLLKIGIKGFEVAAKDRPAAN